LNLRKLKKTILNLKMIMRVNLIHNVAPIMHLVENISTGYLYPKVVDLLTNQQFKELEERIFVHTRINRFIVTNPAYRWRRIWLRYAEVWLPLLTKFAEDAMDLSRRDKILQLRQAILYFCIIILFAYRTPAHSEPDDDGDEIPDRHDSWAKQALRFVVSCFALQTILVAWSELEGKPLRLHAHGLFPHFAKCGLEFSLFEASTEEPESIWRPTR
jgi:hypothetical protein